MSYIRFAEESFWTYWRYNFFSLPMIKNDDKLEIVLRTSNKKILEKVQKKYFNNIKLKIENWQEKVEDIYCCNMELISDTMVDLSDCVIKELVCERVSMVSLGDSMMPHGLRRLVMIGCGLEEVELRAKAGK